MSLRLGLVMIFVALGCAGPPPASSNEPKTAKEKQLQTVKSAGEPDAAGNAKWKTWRYTGDRADCRYVVGRRCFKTEKAACDAAACRGSTCDVVGAGPASVTCKRDAKDPK